MRGTRTSFAVAVLAIATLLPGQMMVTAQGTPEPAPATPVPGLLAAGATLANRDGTIIGTASFNEGDDGRVIVSVSVIEGLSPGEHGIHVHAVGKCEPGGDEPFASAGEHFNPTGAKHPEHAGDLGNITAAENGGAEFEFTTDRFTLSPGPASLDDDDESALLIHEAPDDLQTDPTGNSGGRIACGVINLGEGSMVPEATPMVPAEASPAAPGGVPTAEATPA